VAQELITAIDLLSRIGEVKPFEILDEVVFPCMRHTALVLRDPCWRIEHPIGILKLEILDGAAMSTIADYLSRR
jgi:hypothetical protein